MNSPALLEIKNLSIDFVTDKGTFNALKNINLSIGYGETLGIVGESGSGKSVTFLAVMKLLHSTSAKITGGSIVLTPKNQPSIDLIRLSEKEMTQIRGKYITMIFQEPMTSLNPVKTCGHQVAEIIRLHEKDNKKISKEKTLELFNEVLLPRPDKIFSAYPHELSGGQKQRVMIAMAIATKPALLIADEPTTALDVTVQKSILELLKSLQQKYKMSMAFITHDLGVVSEIAQRSAILYKGQVVEEDYTDVLLKSAKHPYTRGLLACRPRMDVRYFQLPTLPDFLHPDYQLKVFETETLEQRKSRHSILYSREPLIRVNNLCKYYPLQKGIFGKPFDYIKAIDNVSFTIYPGETLGLVGESGCGKTTLGRTILRMIEPTSGEVYFKSKLLNALSINELRKLRKKVQIIFQDPYSSLNPRIIAGEAITEPMRIHQLHGSEAERKKKTVELLEKVGLDEKAYYRYPHEFSGGQRQRICIARALSVEPEFVICDESVSALDVSVQAQVLNLLNELKRDYHLTYLFISHDLSVVKYMSDRMIVMKNGQIVEEGEADSLYLQPVSDYTKTLIQAIPGLGKTLSMS